MPHQCTDCGRQFDDGSKEMLSGCPECGGNKFQFLPAGQSDESAPDHPSREIETESDRSVARTVGNAATAVRDLVGSSSERSPPEPGFQDSEDPVGSTGTSEPGSTAPPDAGSTTAADTSTTAADTSTTAADTSSTTPETTPADTASTATTDTRSSPSSEYRQPPQPKQTAASMAETEDEAQKSARSDVISPDELPPSPQQESSWSDERATKTESPEPDERPDLSELRAELNEQFESIKVLEPGQYELNLMELFDREEYIVALQEDGKYTVQVPEDWKQ